MQIFDLEGRRLTLPEANLSFPQILSLQDDPHGVRLRLEITPELDCFRGHFPDEPVLPGEVESIDGVHGGGGAYRAGRAPASRSQSPASSSKASPRS